MNKYEHVLDMIDQVERGFISPLSVKIALAAGGADPHVVDQIDQIAVPSGARRSAKPSGVGEPVATHAWGLRDGRWWFVVLRGGEPRLGYHQRYGVIRATRASFERWTSSADEPVMAACAVDELEQAADPWDPEWHGTDGDMEESANLPGHRAIVWRDAKDGVVAWMVSDTMGVTRAEGERVPTVKKAKLMAIAVARTIASMGRADG